MDNKTKRELFQEIEQALGTVKFGSVEIYVSDDRVTQITVRKITKTSIDINEPQEISQTGRQPKTFTIRARLQRLGEQ